MSGSPRRLRAYALTQGRTHTATTLTIDTMLTSTDPLAVPASLGSPEKEAIVRRCGQEPQSPVDLSAALRLPLGTIKVLVADLLDSGKIATPSSPSAVSPSPAVNLDLAELDVPGTPHTPPALPAHRDLTLLEEVLNGIEAL